MGVHRTHQEVARARGAITGEHATGAIGAVRRWCQANEQKTSRRIAESRYSTTPVGVVAVRASFVVRDLPTIRTKARALLTSDNRVVNGRETSRSGEKSSRNGFHRMCCGK
jgi:hypothetical protein